MPYRLTYILDIHYKWKQIYARWTCGGGGGGGRGGGGSKGSLVCCGGLGILLEARRQGFPGVARQHWCPRRLCTAAEATDPIRGSPFSPFTIHFIVWSLLQHESPTGLGDFTWIEHR